MAVVELTEFNITHTLGYGHFGCVLQVERNGRRFAAKAQKKQYEGSPKFRQHQTEAAILRSVCNPNGGFNHVNFAYGGLQFQSIHVVLLDCNNCVGNLRRILSFHGRFDLEIVRNIASQLVKGIRFLHANNVIHLDLKPANTLVLANGTCLLCDFGRSERTTEPRSLRNGTGGEVAYMSPEVVLGCCCRYYVGADWWSLGATLYELRYGYKPFGSSLLTFIRILTCPAFVYVGNNPAKSLIDELLRKRSSRRLGSGTVQGLTGHEQLEAHDFFKDIDLEQPVAMDPDFVALVHEFAQNHPPKAVFADFNWQRVASNVLTGGVNIPYPAEFNWLTPQLEQWLAE